MTLWFHWNTPLSYFMTKMVGWSWWFKNEIVYMNMFDKALDWGSKGSRPAKQLCCVLEQDRLSAAQFWFNPGSPIPTWLKNCWLGRKKSNQTKRDEIINCLILCCTLNHYLIMLCSNTVRVYVSTSWSKSLSKPILGLFMMWWLLPAYEAEQSLVTMITDSLDPKSYFLIDLP